VPVEADSTVRRCAVLGSPIAHSLSPALHRAAYAALGLAWTYDAVEVGEDALPAFMAGLDTRWRGLSLTMPLKRRVLDLCDEVDEVAAMLASANTVVIDSRGARAAFNTDVGGFVDAFAEAGVTELGSVAIVGAGATAASALAAVARMGASQVSILARSPAKAAALTALGPVLGIEVGVRDLAMPPGPSGQRAFDAVVSTIPAAAQSGLAAQLADLAPVVFDVIYHPRLTPLVAQARARGVVVVEGFALLLHQAATQVQLMTGAVQAPLEAMRAAGLAALGNR
jgi:shikimate dehydrogenase